MPIGARFNEFPFLTVLCPASCPAPLCVLNEGGCSYNPCANPDEFQPANSFQTEGHSITITCGGNLQARFHGLDTTCGAKDVEPDEVAVHAQHCCLNGGPSRCAS